jgi:prevent-host-death family protein
MRETTVEQMTKNVAKVLKDAQADRVLVTRSGKPVAMVIGLDNYDEEDLHYMNDEAFWAMIQERRKEPTIPFAQVKKEFAELDAAEARAAQKTKTNGKHKKSKRNGTARN